MDKSCQFLINYDWRHSLTRASGIQFGPTHFPAESHTASRLRGRHRQARARSNPPCIRGPFRNYRRHELTDGSFLLGGKLTRKSLQGYKRKVFWISISATVITALFVSLSLIALSISIEVAVILGCITSATAPAAVLDVVSETKARGKFSTLLLSIVALDDIWALMLFGLGMAIVGSLSGNGGESYFLVVAAREIGGALLLGLLIGLPAAFLTGRIKSGEPILSEAIGIVFLCGGLAI